jgi:hypothetical protein
MTLGKANGVRSLLLGDAGHRLLARPRIAPGRPGRAVQASGLFQPGGVSGASVGCPRDGQGAVRLDYWQCCWIVPREAPALPTRGLAGAPQNPQAGQGGLPYTAPAGRIDPGRVPATCKIGCTWCMIGLIRTGRLKVAIENEQRKRI